MPSQDFEIYSLFDKLDLENLLHRARNSIPWWERKTPEKIAKYIWQNEDDLAQYARSLLQDSAEKYKHFNLNRPFDENMLVDLISNAYKVNKDPYYVSRYIWYNNYGDPLARYARILLKKDIRVAKFASNRELIIRRRQENI
jgi:hypothetical protein